MSENKIKRFLELHVMFLNADDAGGTIPDDLMDEYKSLTQEIKESLLFYDKKPEIEEQIIKIKKTLQTILGNTEKFETLLLKDKLAKFDEFLILLDDFYYCKNCNKLGIFTKQTFENDERIIQQCGSCNAIRPFIPLKEKIQQVIKMRQKA